MADTNRGKIAALTAVIALLTGAFTLFVKWDDWFEEESRCLVSGTAFYDGLTTNAGKPATGTALGIANEAQQFTELATVGADGTFVGNCSSAPGDTFQLYFTRAKGSLGLPCLDIRPTGALLSNPGVHEGVNLRIVPHC